MTALKRAVKLVGGPSALAKLVKVHKSTVSKWLRRGVPAEHCGAVEEATDRQITRKELRPDIFG